MSFEIKLIEPPALKIVCTTQDGERFALPTVRTHHPKIQLQVLSTALRELDDANVDIVDMKTLGSEEVYYKTIKHDDLQFDCYRVGADFENVADIVAQSDVVGVTSPFTQNAQIVTDLAKFIRGKNPKTRLIVGGYDTNTTDRQEYYLQNGFDKVISRNGEVHFPEYIKSEFGTTSKTERRERITVLDDDKRPAKELILPLPNLDNVDLNSYIETEDGALPNGVSLPIGYFVSSRGCDRTCDFCTIWVTNKGNYEVMGAGDVEKLLRHYKNHGVTTLLHAESNLLTRLRYGTEGRRNLIETMKLMREYEFAWEFFDGIEFGRLVKDDGRTPDEELIDLLFNPEIKERKLIGGYRAYIPLEAGYEGRRQTFDKLRPYDVQKDIIKRIVESGVTQISSGLILGFPEDTNETLQESRTRYHELKELVEKTSNGRTETLFVFYVHQLFSGSVDFRKYGSTLTVDVNETPELYQLYTACKPTKEFSPTEVTLLRRQLDWEFNGSVVNEYSERTGRAPTLRPAI